MINAVALSSVYQRNSLDQKLLCRSYVLALDSRFVLLYGVANSATLRSIDFVFSLSCDNSLFWDLIFGILSLRSVFLLTYFSIPKLFTQQNSINIFTKDKIIMTFLDFLSTKAAYVAAICGLRLKIIALDIIAI